MSCAQELSVLCVRPETSYSDSIFVVFIISVLNSASFRNPLPLFIPSFDAAHIC